MSGMCDSRLERLYRQAELLPRTDTNVEADILMSVGMLASTVLLCKVSLIPRLKVPKASRRTRNEDELVFHRGT